MASKTIHTDTLIEALHSAGPHPDLADKLMLFGQFVGAWEIDVIENLPDGPEQPRRGELHFGWALDGRAVVDVWSAPPRGGGRPLCGTTVRFYDLAIDAWRSTWISPTGGWVMPFIGRQVGDEIVLEGTFSEGVLTHWVFSRITSASFHWRAEESRDDGTTWTHLETILARRVS